MSNPKAGVAGSITKALDAYFEQAKSDLRKETTAELKQYSKLSLVKDLIQKSVHDATQQAFDTVRQQRSAKVEKQTKEMQKLADRFKRYDTMLEQHNERIKNQKNTSAEKFGHLFKSMQKAEKSLARHTESIETLESLGASSLAAIERIIKDRKEAQEAKKGQKVEEADEQLNKRVTKLQAILALQGRQIAEMRQEHKDLHDSVWEVLQTDEKGIPEVSPPNMTATTIDLLSLEDDSFANDTVDESLVSVEATSITAFDMEDGELFERGFNSTASPYDDHEQDNEELQVLLKFDTISPTS